MELQAFLSALEERIARYDLLCHPYYQAWTAGQLTRDDLREYASDYYQHVAAFPAYLSALHSRLDDGPLRRAVLHNLCDEEIEGRPHSELWLDFAEGMGADREEVRAASAAARSSQANRRVPPSSARRLDDRSAGSRSTRMSRRFRAWRKAKGDGLAERYGADAKTCGYFKLHQFADVEHSRRVARNAGARKSSRIPSRPKARWLPRKAAAQALWHVLDGMEARRMQAVA